MVAPRVPQNQPITVAGKELTNRFCVHPMGGWDGTLDGGPSVHTLQRWHHFGENIAEQSPTGGGTSRYAVVNTLTPSLADVRAAGSSHASHPIPKRRIRLTALTCDTLFAYSGHRKTGTPKYMCGPRRIMRWQMRPSQLQKVSPNPNNFG